MTVAFLKYCQIHAIQEEDRLNVNNETTALLPIIMSYIYTHGGDELQEHMYAKLVFIENVV